MAAKMGGISVVSYGIGVQNRYSAFLDDEEGFVSPSRTNAPKISASNKRVEQNSAKPKSLSSGKVTNNTNSTANNKTINGGQRRVVKQEQNADSKNQTVSHDGKRQRAGNESNHKKSNKTGNFNQEHNANEKKFQSNGNYQSNAPQHANNREDGENHQQHGSKHVKNNYNNGTQARSRQRNFYNDHDNKKNETVNDSHSNGFGHPMNEEEKRRRQQKRFLDLKHKDPEKKEARQQRQQVVSTDGSKQAPTSPSEQAQKDAKVGFRGPRRNSGPNSGKPQAEDSKAQNGFARGRGRRPDQARDATNGARQDGQAVNGQSSRGGAQQRNNNRVPRNRNGFGGGSRGSRGPKDGEPGRTRRDSDNHKPIPNFSDKSDFPSLAS